MGGVEGGGKLRSKEGRENLSKIFNLFNFSACRVLVKALHVKITEDVCHYTRKTVMCASAVMGSLEFTVNKVNNYDKTHLSCRSNSLD